MPAAQLYDLHAARITEHNIKGCKETLPEKGFEATLCSREELLGFTSSDQVVTDESLKKTNKKNVAHQAEF